VPQPRLFTADRSLAALLSVAVASTVLMTGCMSNLTLTGAPRHVGSDPSGQSVCQAQLWERGGHFVHDKGAHNLLKDQYMAASQSESGVSMTHHERFRSSPLPFPGRRPEGKEFGRIQNASSGTLAAPRTVSSRRYPMAEITWDNFAAASMGDRTAALLASASVREAIAESIHSVREVLAADGVDTTHLLNLGSTAQLLAIAIAPASVWLLDSRHNTVSERRTSESTWLSLATKQPGLTFTAMWDNTLAAGHERKQLGELSWLDEFVLEGSCKGWAVRARNTFERQLPSDAAVGVPIATAARELRGWLVARYDGFVQNILCVNYSRRSWWREFSTASEASVDFWGFYAATRWDFGGLFRARYLGQAALRTYLYFQTRAWAKEHDRERPSGPEVIPDGEIGDSPSGQRTPDSTSAFLDVARDCIDRHKSSFGAEVQAWVEMNLALCQSSYTDFANAMKQSPDSLRAKRSSSYKELARFREAVIHCVEAQPNRIEKASGSIPRLVRSARDEGVLR